MLRRTYSQASCTAQTGASPFSAGPWSCACHGTAIGNDTKTGKNVTRRSKNVGLFDLFDDFMQNQPVGDTNVGAKFTYDTRYGLPDLRIPGYAASCLKLPYVWGQTNTTVRTVRYTW